MLQKLCFKGLEVDRDHCVESRGQKTKILFFWIFGFFLSTILDKFEISKRQCYARKNKFRKSSKKKKNN